VKVEIGDLIDAVLQNFEVDEEEIKLQDPIELTIKIILENQAPNQRSVETALKNLKTQFSGWEEVLNAPDWKVAIAIRDVGYSNLKTTYIKNFLRFCAQHNWNLSWMKSLSVNEAYEILSKIQKIPSKEIRYILAFGIGMPAFPTDQHMKRVIRRLGVLGNSATEEQISKYFESLNDIDHRKLYVAFRKLADKICMARKPKCLICPVSSYCHSVSPSVEYIKVKK
jgi:endonuclease-3